MSAHRTILIVGGTERRKEAKAAAAITPGQLIERTSAGTVQRHSTAGVIAARMFAVEDDLQGNEIGDNYTTGNVVVFELLRSGDEVNALLADGQSVAIGDFLESNGDGDLRVFTADSAGDVEHTNSAVAVALEALDLSGSSGADPSSRRIRSEII